MIEGMLTDVFSLTKSKLNLKLQTEKQVIGIFILNIDMFYLNTLGKLTPSDITKCKWVSAKV